MARPIDNHEQPIEDPLDAQTSVNSSIRTKLHSVRCSDESWAAFEALLKQAKEEVPHISPKIGFLFGECVDALASKKDPFNKYKIKTKKTQSRRLH